MGHLAIWQRKGCFFSLSLFSMLQLCCHELWHTCWPTTLIWGMGGEGKWPYRADKVLQVNSWLWKFLRTLKNTYENVPTFLSKIVWGNWFKSPDKLFRTPKNSKFQNFAAWAFHSHISHLWREIAKNLNYSSENGGFCTWSLLAWALLNQIWMKAAELFIDLIKIHHRTFFG